MSTSDRRNSILDLVNDLEEVSIDFLSERLGVSKSTVYRDLVILENDGEIKRTTSGAIKVNEFLIEKNSYFATGLRIRYNEKKAVAQEAFKYVKSGESIIIDAGTVNFLLAREIHKSNIKDLTIITNNIVTQLLLVKEGSDALQVRVIATGGLIKDGCVSALGDFIEDMLKNIRANKVFLTTKGVSLDGSISEFDYNECISKKFFMDKSNLKILMVESQKFGRIGIYNVARLDDFDILITDSDIYKNKEYLNLIKKLKVDVHIVDV